MLDSIISGVREDLEIRKKQRPKFDFQVDFTREVLDVASALRSNKMNIIAEVKRSSPSKGELASISDPAALASQYEQAGAAVVSVLTESRRFKGSISDFQKVRQTISIPMLRKDFIVDEYQVYESRAIGADLQLLIVAALSKSELLDFFQMANELNMQSLFEVHSLEELEIAMDVSPKIIGVNSRNLKTLEVDSEVFDSLIPRIPNDIIKVAESGISNRAEVAHLENLGAHAILVGETLVKAQSAGDAIADLLAR